MPSYLPDVFLALNGVFAGITFFGGLACGAIWLYNRDLRAFLWCGVLGLAMTACLLSGASVFAGVGLEHERHAVFLRTTLYGCCVLLAVHTAAHLLPGLAVRWIQRVLVVVLVVGTALWWPTDLLVDQHVQSDGWPRYGPLAWTNALFNVGVMAAGALAYRRSKGKVQLLILACGVWLGFFTVTTHLLDSGAVREEMLTLQVLPGGIMVLFLAGRALLRNARGHDTLIRRQELLLQLSQAAVTEPIDTVRRRVERELRAELHRDLVVAVSGLDRFPQPGTPGSTIRVSGRRQRAVVRGLGPQPKATQQFVEAALRILLAASERAMSDTEHAHAAGHDHATGLANLVSLSGRLDDRLHAGDWPLDGAARFLVLQCRLVGLEQLGAVDGADRVNSLVHELTDTLSALRRSRTIVARISADTFCLADQVPPGEERTFLTARLSEVRTALATALPGAVVSIGAAEAKSGTSARTLLSDAALALERAPAGGDAVFDDAVGADVRARVALERDLTQAVERDEIEVHYQPVTTADGRTVVAYEALARWRRHGAITPPDTWVSSAERLGVIGEIDRRVLQVAARDQARLDVPVAVNVSPLDLAGDSFVTDVLSAIGDCPPNQVILEITETAVMADVARSIVMLQELRSRGVLIALDDFGSSYSSLSALADLPVDILKLDASFVTRLDQPNGVTVMKAVIGLARSLGKPIVAEGIETEDQLTVVTTLGADRVQGYLIGRPAGVDPLADSDVAGGADAPARRRLFVVGAVPEVG